MIWLQWTLRLSTPHPVILQLTLYSVIIRSPETRESAVFPTSFQTLVAVHHGPDSSLLPICVLLSGQPMWTRSPACSHTSASTLTSAKHLNRDVSRLYKLKQVVQIVGLQFIYQGCCCSLSLHPFLFSSAMTGTISLAPFQTITRQTSSQARDENKLLILSVRNTLALAEWTAIMFTQTLPGQKFNTWWKIIYIIIPVVGKPSPEAEDSASFPTRENRQRPRGNHLLWSYLNWEWAGFCSFCFIF